MPNSLLITRDSFTRSTSDGVSWRVSFRPAALHPSPPGGRSHPPPAILEARRRLRRTGCSPARTTSHPSRRAGGSAEPGWLAGSAAPTYSPPSTPRCCGGWSGCRGARCRGQRAGAKVDGAVLTRAGRVRCLHVHMHVGQVL